MIAGNSMSLSSWQGRIWVLPVKLIEIISDKQRVLIGKFGQWEPRPKGSLITVII